MVSEGLSFKCPVQATLELMAGPSGIASEAIALQSQSDVIFHDACRRLQSQVSSSTS